MVIHLFPTLGSLVDGAFSLGTHILIELVVRKLLHQDHMRTWKEQTEESSTVVNGWKRKSQKSSLIAR